MQEIIFKGKRVDNGEWIEGFYIKDEYHTSILYQHSPLYGFDKINVIPETVGQFTGICDKNDIKIFEEDILYLSSINEIGKITFSADGIQFITKKGIFDDFWYFISDSKVIGNIHDKENNDGNSNQD